MNTHERLTDHLSDKPYVRLSADLLGLELHASKCEGLEPVIVSGGGDFRRIHPNGKVEILEGGDWVDTRSTETNFSEIDQGLLKI